MYWGEIGATSVLHNYKQMSTEYDIKLTNSIAVEQCMREDVVLLFLISTSNM